MLTSSINTPVAFSCHAFLDNTTLCIVEISTKTKKGSGLARSFHWLLVNKLDLSVRELSLKSRDDSNSVQERFFDMGYLKYNSNTGIFIAVPSHEQHPLEMKDCSQVPENYLSAISDWVSNMEVASV